MRPEQPRIDELAETIALLAGRIVGSLTVLKGTRRPADHLVETFFLGMAERIARDGVPRRVAADMFGVSRRTYIRRVRAAEVQHDLRRRTAWSGVHRAARDGGVTREALHDQLPGLPERQLNALIHDMLVLGWLVHDQDRLVAVLLDTHLDEDQLAELVDALWRVDPASNPRTLAHELGIPLDRIQAHWSRRRDFLWSTRGPGQWPVLNMLVHRFFAFLDGRLHRPAADFPGGVWTIRMSRLTPEALASLRQTTADVRDQLGRASASQIDGKVERYADERLDGTVWTAIQLELVDSPGTVD